MLTPDELWAVLDYDPVTGIFTWIAPTWGPRKFGAVAGRTNNQGYRQIQIDGKLYQAARLAWLFMHGEWPPEQIDHINRVRSDNRFCNLRAASASENVINRDLKNTILRGTVKLRGRWQAQIGIGNKRIYLGLYDTREEAHSAYLKAAEKYHGVNR